MPAFAGSIPAAPANFSNGHKPLFCLSFLANLEPCHLVLVTCRATGRGSGQQSESNGTRMQAALSKIFLHRGCASLPNLFLTNQGQANFNSREIHAAEIGSANGVSNARGLAKMYAPLANGGGPILSEQTVNRMSRVCAATQLDAVLMQPMRFAMGFMASTDNRANGGDSVILGEAAFGHVGMGGSIGFADPAVYLSFGYTMNRMGAGILLNERGQSLVDAAYLALGRASDASGAWRD